MKDWLEFKEDQFEEEDELLLAMKEINQRRNELKISENEWFSTWMLGRVKKRKRMDNFEYQALRNVIKEGGVNVIDNFERKYKELKIEGNRKKVAETMYVEPEKETFYMGSESEARKDIKEMGIDMEAPINVESLMDVKRDRDLHLEGHGMMDTFLEGHGMVAISLGIEAENRLGGDRIQEEEMSFNVIDHEL